MDVHERFSDISLELNLTSAVSFAAWNNYEKTRKVFCLEVCICDGLREKSTKTRASCGFPAQSYAVQWVRGERRYICTAISL